MDKEIQKMEEAALRAYMKDIQGSGDFTSQLVLEGLEQKQRAADEAAEKQAEAKQAREAAKAREKIDLELKRKRVKEKAKATKWHEARSDEGYSYYWHVDTNETKWEPPADGYISIADQKVLEEAEKAKAEVNVPGKKGKGKHFSGGKKRKPEDSGAPPSATKKMVPEAKAAASSSKAEKLPKNIPTMGPAPKPNPYGLWKSIEKKVEVEPVDLELPSQQQAEIKVPALVDDRPKIKFHEKKISRPIVDDDASTSQPTFTGFKKKGNFRGNTRQRLDTDD
ncbi:WW domain-binding protein 4-like isoform X3 [Thrips palmi]|nr:WW domain-binding protein 4-like isoform X3 [Thrips palmi]